jgi:hypothetical protein
MSLDPAFFKRKKQQGSSRQQLDHSGFMYYTSEALKYGTDSAKEFS